MKRHLQRLWSSSWAKDLYRLYLGLWYTATSRRPFGTNVYDRPWDLLIVLDACRVDALRAVADEYSFIDRVKATTSVGSHSYEWLANTFTREYLDEVRETAYLTANSHAQLLFVDGDTPPIDDLEPPLCWPDWDPVHAEDFLTLELAWQGGYDEAIGNVPPRYMTDTAVDTAREHHPDRLVVHYMQPHDPFIHDYVRTGRELTEVERNPTELLRRGEVSAEDVWGLYLDNLRLVLDEVELLLRSVDADRVAITADHGEALGEFGFADHPEGALHPVIRRVPWVRTTATDDGTYEPDRSTHGEGEVREHLRNLGYL